MTSIPFSSLFLSWEEGGQQENNQQQCPFLACSSLFTLGQLIIIVSFSEGKRKESNLHDKCDDRGYQVVVKRA